MIEVFDNFAFDEVPRHGDLDTKMRLMAILVAQQTLSEYKVMLGGALNVGVTPIEAKEILYHSVPYVGVAKAFEFIHATNEVLKSRGVELPLEGKSTTTPENPFRERAGADCALPSTQFPNLTDLREALVAETAQAGASVEGVPRGRRALRGPAHRNAQRNLAARRRSNHDQARALASSRFWGE